MLDADVLIAGAGIGGLSAALTLNQIGIKPLVLESVSELKPLGVGINLQPNAVRELFDLGITPEQLDDIGIATKEWALVSRNGKEVYSEPRGLDAGYLWPQYSVHRGELQMLLLRLIQERLGKNVIRTNSALLKYENHKDHVTVTTIQDQQLNAKLLIGADGLHSQVRAQMHPDQAPIHWGGAVMWRGVSKAKPLRSGASFVGLGSHEHRLVMYPISAADPETGLANINWIAEKTFDASEGWSKGDWNKQVELSEFAHYFEDWNYDWLNVPELIASAESVYEYPMVDRDPVSTWVDDRVLLIGDAAHAMYPTGSNGASQAIMDARILGAKLLEYGTHPNAITALDQQLCADISAVVLRNRGAGPFVLLKELEQRCGGVFSDIERVFPKHERDELMQNYKQAAGFAMEQLNQAPPTIER